MRNAEEPEREAIDKAEGEFDTPLSNPLTTAAPFYFVFGVLFVGFIFAALVATPIINEPWDYRSLQISFYLLGAQDTVWLALACLAYPLLWWLSRRSSLTTTFGARAGSVLALAFAVFTITYFGAVFVYHDFALSMDEFMMRWHSDLLQAGFLLAPVSEGWLSLSLALRPGFLITDPLYQVWVPGYRPGTALLHAGFTFLKLGSAMNAAFCAGSVLVLWQVARRVLLQNPSAILCAVIVFASAPQFLITGMTPYTMTAHLFASLLWLWLYIEDRPVTHAAAIVLGCYALGLHHVHVHAFMVLPFLVHLLIFQRRWRLFLIYGTAYSLAGLCWLFWIDLAIWLQGLTPASTFAPAAVDGDIGFVMMTISQGIENHGAVDLLHWATNLTRLVAWQNLAALPLIVIALVHVRKMPVTLQLVSWSVVTSLIPYVLLMPTQGHGWGYRYLHHSMGSIGLLAGFGWSIALSQGHLRMLRFAVLLGGFSFFVAFPLRAFQTEAIVRPFAETVDMLKAQPVDVVLIETAGIWYGRDLVRNDPLLRTAPVILSLEHIPDAELARLCAEQSVLYVDERKLVHSGMLIQPAPENEPMTRRAQTEQRLELAGCRQ